jgi:molecular chaperone DnaK
MNPQAGAHLDAFPQGLDLLDWFRQTLRQGLAHEQVRHQDLACVILTTGSSAWPFVADIVTEELRQIEPSQIERSPRLVHSGRSYVAVSQGLVIVPALQRRLAATSRARGRTRSAPNRSTPETNWRIRSERGASRKSPVCRRSVRSA